MSRLLSHCPRHRLVSTEVGNTFFIFYFNICYLIAAGRSWTLSLFRLAAIQLNNISNFPENLNEQFVIAEITVLQYFFIPATVLSFIPPCFFSCLWPSDTDYLRYLFPQFVKSNLYHLCYTSIGQRISICNYWNGETNGMRLCRRLWPSVLTSLSSSSDPHHRDLYVNSSDYLALLNSERANPNSTGQ